MAYPQQSSIQTTFAPFSFWNRRRTVVRKNTLLYQLSVLKKTGRYDAFRLKWHPIYDDEDPLNWPVPKHLFWDSDVAKWIESACYFLREEHDKEIDDAVQELVEMIGKAQQPDGYNAGHLIEAAYIHHLHYQNDLLLRPITKYISLLSQTFGPGPHQIHGYPGHPEIELALLRLYSITHEPTHLSLARYFITERGNPHGVDGKHFYSAEAEKRGEKLMERQNPWPKCRSFWYMQAHKPILEQDSVEGHSVRAMYLLTAVADLVRLDEESKNYSGNANGNDSAITTPNGGTQTTATPYRDPLHRLWHNMINKKMYLTGGIGAIHQWEGFGIDYFLPQGTSSGGCYAETCASIGVMMLAERLLQIDLDGKYADVMELCLYNAVLTAMSLDGTKFTYVNQLASSEDEEGGKDGGAGDGGNGGSSLSKREAWFEVACCPPNVCRTMGILGGYVWSHGEDEGGVFVNVHLYTSASLEFQAGGGQKKVELKQESNWPWEGDVKFELKTSSDIPVTIRLRIPAWAEGYEISPSLPSATTIQKGYLTLPPSYTSHHRTFTLSISGFTPRLIRPHPYTASDIVAVARGPIVYCVEDVDNPWVTNHFRDVAIDTSVPLRLLEVGEKIGGKEEEEYVAIKAPGAGVLLEKEAEEWTLFGGGKKGGDGKDKEEEGRRDLVFVPYYARANRGGKGMMRVGLRVMR
ncbi:uncharacterized protein BP5553_05757 [Venustampulla echinocandica]|uniref:DUF1680-domain-containing protein n=1 Tax=Venustampulla echinocandica TaxID=2656787 RepID=A0A370TLL0_9HELO|nr:uncharacterized protein BP5553_05757 [Venustampulla echinocandica]RDL36405.1 hypothetical protein BP5553_05757 [Venustampulla echinocandica]